MKECVMGQQFTMTSKMATTKKAPAAKKKSSKEAKGEAKIAKVMQEFKEGELHSGSEDGPIVTNKKQAVAIALSEAREAGADIPEAPKTKKKKAK
jgi:hypothetical protein